MLALARFVEIRRFLSGSLLLVLLFTIGNAMAQTTAFTYQGKLADSGSPANGSYDFQFKLFDLASGGAQQGPTVSSNGVSVISGIFTVSLDFGGGVFPGANRFLEIAVKPASGSTFTLLSPRQQITSTPYTIFSGDSAKLSGIAASGFIQNTTSTQAATNFNIGGTGAANTFDAATQYNIGGSRVLSASAAAANLFAGPHR